MQDSDIIELYWQRSERAIAETANKYGTYAHSIAHAILQNDADAEECVNDAYLRLWNAIPPARPNGFRTFLGKIVRNLSLNRYQKQTAHKRGAGQVALVLEELSECIPSPDRDGAALTDDIVIRQALNRFLGRLPRDARIVFLRRYFYMESVEKIADACGWTQSKVTVTLSRLRQRLRQELKKEGIDV